MKKIFILLGSCSRVNLALVFTCAKWIDCVEFYGLGEGDLILLKQNLK